MTTVKEQLRRAEIAAAFRQERDAVLRSLDPARMNAFFRRWRQPLPERWSTDKPNAQLACMHLARLYVGGMTPEEKLVSAKWLVENTYSLPPGIELDGDTLTGVHYGAVSGDVPDASQ